MNTQSKFVKGSMADLSILLYNFLNVDINDKVFESNLSNAIEEILSNLWYDAYNAGYEVATYEG